MTTRENIRDHLKASNALWRELERQGYQSGGCDSKFKETAIIKGNGPNAKIVGYVDIKSLSIRWTSKEKAE